MSGTSNPLRAFVETRLLHAFLRSGSTSIYQETLGISIKADQAAVRAAYRTLALNLHPDKIRQKFQREVTEEETAKLLLAKEAYQILR